jgi:hypothetical protein
VLDRIGQGIDRVLNAGGGGSCIHCWRPSGGRRANGNRVCRDCQRDERKIAGGGRGTRGLNAMSDRDRQKFDRRVERSRQRHG